MTAERIAELRKICEEEEDMVGVYGHCTPDALAVAVEALDAIEVLVRMRLRLRSELVQWLHTHPADCYCQCCRDTRAILEAPQ